MFIPRNSIPSNDNKILLIISSNSKSAYDDIPYDEKYGTDILILPSRRRLWDYKNYIKPETGFNKNINEIKDKIPSCCCDGASKLFKMHFPMTNKDDMNPAGC